MLRVGVEEEEASHPPERNPKSLPAKVGGFLEGRAESEEDDARFLLLGPRGRGE